MSVPLYDEAFVNKLRQWVQDPNMKITSPDETRRLFSFEADIKDDQPIVLPLIALRRGREINLLSTNKRALTFDGFTLNANTRKSDQLNIVPISLTYSIDIYTRYQQEACDYFREFVFNIINHPKLEIEIPYNNASIKHVANIRLQDTIIDNSDIAERLVPGQFTRFTIPVYIDDAYIFDYKIRNNYTVTSEVVLSED